jgi:hypothetical protein
MSVKRQKVRALCLSWASHEGKRPFPPGPVGHSTPPPPKPEAEPSTPGRRRRRTPPAAPANLPRGDKESPGERDSPPRPAPPRALPPPGPSTGRSTRTLRRDLGGSSRSIRAFPAGRARNLRDPPGAPAPLPRERNRASSGRGHHSWTGPSHRGIPRPACGGPPFSRRELEAGPGPEPPLVPPLPPRPTASRTFPPTAPPLLFHLAWPWTRVYNSPQSSAAERDGRRNPRHPRILAGE